MGWDFSGTEDEFFEYCDSVSPNNEYYDNYDDRKDLEDTTHELLSYFLDKFCLSVNLKDHRCLPYQIENFKVNISSEILSYIELVTLVLRYNEEGELIKDLKAYNQEIKICNPSVYSSRKTIFNHTKLLREEKYFSTYNKIKEFKNYLVKSHDYRFLDKTDIVDIISGRYLSFSIDDPLIRLLTVATLYEETFQRSTKELKYKQFDYNLLETQDTNKYSPFYQFNNYLSSKNIFDNYLCKCSVQDHFPDLIKRLANAFELFLNYSYGKDCTIFNDLSIDFDNKLKIISLKSKKYLLTIEKSVTRLDQECLQIRLYNLAEEEKFEIFSLKTKPNLEPFTYDSKRKEEFNKVWKENRAAKRKGYSYKLLEEQGNNLREKFIPKI